jgi:nitric oxide reductase NorD protein
MTEDRTGNDATELERLSLLATAIARTSVAVAAAEPGDETWTDGATIFLDTSTRKAHQIEMLCVQASLLAAGSLGHDIARRLARRPTLARRYLAVEGHRVLAADDDVLPTLVLRLVDHDLAGRVTSPEDSFVLARSDQLIADAPPAFGTIHPRRILAAGKRSESAHALTATNLGTARTGDRAAFLDDEDEDDDLGNLLSSPVGGGGAVGRLLVRLLAPVRKRSGGGPPGADAPTHVAGGRAGTGRRAVASNTPPPALDGAPLTPRHDTRYPEWDVHRRRYRPDWCTVIESDAPVDPGASAKIPDAVALRRSLARLGIGLTPCRRRRQGDDIDIDAAVEARVDALAGSPHDDDFYVESLRRRRDLAVLVLLDVSGSAAEPGTRGRSVHDHQRSVAAGLTAALHDLGDRVALYAFNSRGRTAVQLFRIKRFDDQLDGLVARRIDSLRPAAYTRLGAAIRHGSAILDERAGTSRRLLVVVSDGFAYDHGYEGHYGEADARRSLVEARRRGMGCLCLSVGTDVDPVALRRVFGTASHATLPTPEQLPAMVGPLFRAALHSAEAQRHTFQRKERSKELLAIERNANR